MLYATRFDSLVKLTFIYIKILAFGEILSNFTSSKVKNDNSKT